MTLDEGATVVLNAVVVDDEALARARMRTLLGDCKSPAVQCLGEAANAVEAMALAQHHRVDVAFVDIHMPGADGLALARALRSLEHPPALVFVTAHAEHAVDAFDLEAADYLTKPVRLERLQQALQKTERLTQRSKGPQPENTQDSLLIQDRGRIERVPLAEVLYLRAELKYITVRTAVRSYILDGSLNELEERHSAHFLRVHRSALVARRALRAIERFHDPEEGDGWAVRLTGVDELLPVSRRQLAAVREALGQ